MSGHLFGDTAVLSGRSLRHTARSADTVITIASGISCAAFRLLLDMRSGIFERFHSMPIARTSAMWAHVVTSLVANLISLVVVVLLVLLMDFRSAAGWGRGAPSSPVSRPSPRTVRARSPTR